MHYHYNKLPGAALTGQREHSQFKLALLDNHFCGTCHFTTTELLEMSMNISLRMMHWTQTDRLPCQTDHTETSVG